MSESIPQDPDRDEGALDADQGPTREQIEQRAYELSESDGSASPEENWDRAERELRGAV
jgi:Protein of unknown function (DUF2934)